MSVTFERRIDALGGTRNEDGEYNAGFHDGYSRALEDAMEIARDADVLIHELHLALLQYRADITYPIDADSRDRRHAMIDRLIAKAVSA